MDAPVRRVRARAFTLPTDGPEADGTLAWDKTTMVLAEVEAADTVGLGYTYTDASAATLINDKLSEILAGKTALDIPAASVALWRSVRNIGRSGLVATAISALDCALWDLKAKLLKTSLAALLGRARAEVSIYGSGGFTSYSNEKLRQQLSGWVEREGCRWVKMKIGSEPERDPSRVEAARSAIGDSGLFVDANGAFGAQRAIGLATHFADQGVMWFEEPVSSDDVRGLAFVRQNAPAGMEVAAGEYGYRPDDFRRWLEGQAVDVLQADVTRCGGVSAFLEVGALCEAHHVDLSGHCAPAMHLPVACAVPRLRHLEWFHDHVRVERMLFEGAPAPCAGKIAPDLERPGFGLVFKERDAQRFEVATK